MSASIHHAFGRLLGLAMKERRLLMWAGPWRDALGALRVPLTIVLGADAWTSSQAVEGAAVEGFVLRVDGAMASLRRADIVTGADLLRAQRGDVA